MTRSVILFFSFFWLCHFFAQGAEYRFYVGTYTAPEKSEGIYTAIFDSHSGTMTPLKLAAKLQNPSFLAVHPQGKVVYALSESNNATVNAFLVKEDGDLVLLNSQPTGGDGACYVSVDATGSCVLVANYGGGSVASFPILPSGALAERASFFQFTGSGPNKARQEKPHAHSILADPSNKRAYSCDLGTDKISIFQMDPSSGVLTVNDPPYGEGPSGGGARHLVFHPKLPVLYFNNELTCTVSTYSWNAVTGEIKPLQELSSLPDAQTEGSSSEIIVHPNGRSLYVSNRVHNSIATFDINSADGSLTFLEAFKIDADIPRNITLDPTGAWMISAGQKNNVLKTNPIDITTGKLKSGSHTVPVFSPVCVVFLRPAAKQP